MPFGSPRRIPSLSAFSDYVSVNAEWSPVDLAVHHESRGSLLNVRDIVHYETGILCPDKEFLVRQCAFHALSTSLTLVSKGIYLSETQRLALPGIGIQHNVDEMRAKRAFSSRKRGARAKKSKLCVVQPGIVSIDEKDPSHQVACARSGWSRKESEMKSCSAINRRRPKNFSCHFCQKRF